MIQYRTAQFRYGGTGTVLMYGTVQYRTGSLVSHRDDVIHTVRHVPYRIINNFLFRKYKRKKKKCSVVAEKLNP